MATYQELEQQIKDLTSNLQAKESELWLLQSEFTDLTKADDILAEQSGLFIQMMDEYLEYYSDRKETDKSKASKMRLILLMGLNTDLGSISSANYTLKMINRALQGKNHHLRELVMKLNNEINKINQATNF